MKSFCVALCAFACGVFVYQPMLAQPAKPTLDALAAAGQVKIDSIGTGETIGHVADLKIQNLTDQPITCAVGPVVLESKSRKNQDYVIPTRQTATIGPRSTATVPVNGVCINRNKPPVGKGAPGDLVVNTGDPGIPANPDSHVPTMQARDLLRICKSKYEAADKLQKDGALRNLPYKDKQKQKDIVVQWSTWCDPRISQITGNPPATKEDLRKVVYKQVEAKGKMSPETKKKVDQGIDTIFEKVELTTTKAKDLERLEAKIPAFAAPAVEEAPSTGQPVSAPTAAPGESVAATPTAAPQGPGSTTTQPTATPTPCKKDAPIDLDRANFAVDKAIKACTDLDRLDREAGEAEDAADADDATPAGKDAKAKADKAAADAKAAKEIADEADASAKAAAEAKAKDAKAKARDAKTKADEAKAKATAAEGAKSPLRKKADAARRKVMDAVGAKWDALREAKDAIGKLKCPENKDKLTEKLKEGCGEK